MKSKKGLDILDKVTNGFEVSIAVLLLLVIAIKTIDTIFLIADVPVIILDMEFNRILSVAFTLVIGAEFVRMLCKHTPETVIDVLLFAIARQMVLYHENTLNLMGGVAAIAGLFATRKFLVDRKSKTDAPKRQENIEKT